jgi:DNA-directed RNA polymerase specialized sigma24 family protein
MSDEVLNRQLQQLAIVAKQHEPGTKERQIALNKLINAILRSSQVGHPQSGQWAASLYEDLYNEALQKTWMEICQKIEQYNPAYPVMAWVNIILQRRFIDVVREYQRQGRTNLPQRGENRAPNVLSLDDLDKEVPANEEDSDDRRVREFLRDDPENLLKQEHIRGRMDVTLQKVIWLKFVEDKTWEEMSAELNVAIPSLASFFQRRLHKLKPYFEKYLQI